MKLVKESIGPDLIPDEYVLLKYTVQNWGKKPIIKAMATGTKAEMEELKVELSKTRKKYRGGYELGIYKIYFTNRLQEGLKEELEPGDYYYDNDYFDKDAELLENLAALEHEQWAHWTEYMLDNLSAGNITRWREQINTPYDKLSEKEKESDREWARKVLTIFNTQK